MSEFFKRPKVIAIVVISILAVIILLQNMAVVTFSIFFWQINVSQLLLVLLMLAIGYVLGFLTAKLTPRKE
jgi:putative membrane protein